jgi:hypothetical protein
LIESRIIATPLNEVRQCFRNTTLPTDASCRRRTSVVSFRSMQLRLANTQPMRRPIDHTRSAADDDNSTGSIARPTSEGRIDRIDVPLVLRRTAVCASVIGAAGRPLRAACSYARSAKRSVSARIGPRRSVGPSVCGARSQCDPIARTCWDFRGCRGRGGRRAIRCPTQQQQQPMTLQWRRRRRRSQVRGAALPVTDEALLQASFA